MGEKPTGAQIGWSDRDGFVYPIEALEALGFPRLARGRFRAS